MVQVLAVDVRHHGDGREQVAERAVRFVGLRDQDLAAAEASVRPEGPRLAADDRGRSSAASARIAASSSWSSSVRLPATATPS